MAHLGKRGPCAWCRDLSFPTDGPFRNLPKFMHGACDGTTAAVGWHFDEGELISDEAQYDYNEGWVSWTYHQDNSDGHCEFEFRNYISIDPLLWFDCYCILRTDSVVILEAWLPFPDTRWTDLDAWNTNSLVMDGDDVLAYLAFHGDCCLWANLPV